MVDDDTWPPEQLKCYTPLLLVNYQGHRSSKQVIAMAKLMCSGKITSVASANQSGITHHPKLHTHGTLQDALDATTVTEKLEEILAPLEHDDQPSFILIEGAPGIGKSVLLKEIAFQWGRQHLLKKFNVVLLLCLREPILQQAQSISDLLQYFCRGDLDAMEITTACSRYFFDNGGKDLVFLLDGLDELPENLRTKSLIADILKRRILPYCGLVVSSRPHATKQLHKQATLRVDILGFTEQERKNHIQQALQGQPYKSKELIQYLDHHLNVGSLCYVPFNLVILLYLYKQGISLPKNISELYNYFICQTISRHLTKCGNSSNVTNLTNLPEPYNIIIQQLSKLSVQALNNNKLVFTIDEIKAACPDIITLPQAINGFGLLQAVQYFGLIGTITTFNFIHFSIQEYLAAHHIANLPAEDELRIIERYYWSDIHFNMFSIYISLTKGQHPSFKHFLSGGNKAITISDKFLNDPLQCFRLYHCFHEAGRIDICKIIQQSGTFTSKSSGITLTAGDVKCITTYLTTSFCKESEYLSWPNFCIQDHGLLILHRGLLNHSGIIINKLNLENNGLTAQSSSLISDITVKCEVKYLCIDYNYTVGENEQLYFMLTYSSTMLQELHMSNIALSSGAAIALFNTLKYNNKLKTLFINNNNITDEACNSITTALERNNCLVRLALNNNPLTCKAVVNIVNALKDNIMLAILKLPQGPQHTEEIITLLEAINKKRESKGCQVKLIITCCS